MGNGRCWWAAVVVLTAIGCGNPGSGGTLSSGGTSTSSSGTTSSGSGETTTSGSGTTTGTVTATCTLGAGGAGPVVQPSGFTCSGATPHLSAAVVPITTSNCSISAACHSAMQTSGGVVNMLVNIIAEECTDERLMIKPCDPEHSYVIDKLTGHNLDACNPTTTMPLNGSPLSKADVQTIYDWICAGAIED